MPEGVTLTRWPLRTGGGRVKARLVMAAITPQRDLAARLRRLRSGRVRALPGSLASVWSLP